MHHFRHLFAGILTFVCCIGISPVLHAANETGIQTTWRTSDGFILCLPAVNLTNLMGKTQKLKDTLEARRDTLDEKAGNGKLSGNDLLITAIMPGGLLYAAYRQGSMTQAKSDLEEVENTLEEVNGNLAALQTLASEALVAQRP